MIDRLIVFTAQDLFFLLPILVAVILFQLPRNERLTYFASLALGGIVALCLAKLASHVFFDPRPFVNGHVTPLFAHAPDNGFPSDHTTFGTTLAFISFAYARKWGMVMIPIAILIGVARVFAHVHSWVDIAGGIATGLVASTIAVYICRSGIAKGHKERSRPVI
jgi:undecaprenyl-diphosphatase